MTQVHLRNLLSRKALLATGGLAALLAGASTACSKGHSGPKATGSPTVRPAVPAGRTAVEYPLQRFKAIQLGSGWEGKVTGQANGHRVEGTYRRWLEAEQMLDGHKVKLVHDELTLKSPETGTTKVSNTVYTYRAADGVLLSQQLFHDHGAPTRFVPVPQDRPLPDSAKIGDQPLAPGFSNGAQPASTATWYAMPRGTDRLGMTLTATLPDHTVRTSTFCLDRQGALDEILVCITAPDHSVLSNLTITGKDTPAPQGEFSLAALKGLLSAPARAYTVEGTSPTGERITGTFTAGRKPDQTLGGKLFHVGVTLLDTHTVSGGGSTFEETYLTPAGAAVATHHLPDTEDSTVAPAALVSAHGLPVRAKSGDQGPLFVVSSGNHKVETTWSLTLPQGKTAAILKLTSVVSEHGTVDTRGGYELRYLVEPDGTVREAQYEADLEFTDSFPARTTLTMDLTRPLPQD